LELNDAMPVFLLPLGARLDVTVSLIGDDEQPVAPPAKPKRAFHDLPRSQQAALKCQDRKFQEWIESGAAPDFQEWHLTMAIGKRLIAMSEDCAANYTRYWCNVKSRAEFDTDKTAGQKWDKLLTQYEIDTDRIAEARG